tara:strand:+ start:1199 stop:1459 length:261 start_codon:yes stop_codon:yes gene_type:complete
MGRKKITASREEKAGFMSGYLDDDGAHTRCPLCSGEQGEVEIVIENYEGHDWGGNAIDQFRSVPVRKCRNCGAFHDKHGKLIEDGL